MHFVDMLMLKVRIIQQLDPASICMQAARSSGLSHTAGLPGYAPKIHMTVDLSTKGNLVGSRAT